jgi:protease-4
MEFVHESIFISTVRSFCKFFFGALGFCIAFLVASIAYSAFSSPFVQEQKTQMTLLPKLDWTYGVSSSSPVILQVAMEGEVGTNSGFTADSIEDILMASRTGILGSRVKGILLKMNTPGGSALEGDRIYRMLKSYKEKYKVPLFAYTDGLCASAGMLITSAADKSYATYPSVIGSIGVIWGPFFNVSELMGRYGVASKTLTEGLNKDELSQFRPWKENEGDEFKAMMAESYNRFVDIFTSAHPRVDKQKLIAEYGAKAFTATEAQKIGYIDVAGAEYSDALADLLAEAKIDPAKDYQVVRLSPHQNWIPSVPNQISHEVKFNLKNLSESLPILNQAR